jgi:glycosyltransferase involved in cell wall biosynthesis
MDTANSVDVPPHALSRRQQMTAEEPRASLALVSTVPYAIDVYYRQHIAEIAKIYDLTIITGADGVEAIRDLENVATIVTLPLSRKISPLQDLANVLRLRKILVSNKIALLQTVSPKGGLVGMIAGALARTPVRIHTFTGQVWATKRGLARQALRLLDKITATLSTSILVDSASQLRFLVNEGVVPDGKAVVLGEGSIAGVDVARFSPDANIRDVVREQLGYAKDDVVILYLGRVTMDKGMKELSDAFNSVRTRFPWAQLLIVGPDEGGTSKAMRDHLGPNAEAARFIGFTREPQNFMRAADIFCIPSYREGFGSVIIEAGACGLPTVATNIYGITDAVAEGETALLVPPKDKFALSDRLLKLCVEAPSREAMGNAARERAVRFFDASHVSRMLLFYYQDKLIRRERSD